MPQICEQRNEYFGLLSVLDQVLPVSSGLPDENLGSGAPSLQFHKFEFQI